MSPTEEPAPCEEEAEDRSDAEAPVTLEVQSTRHTPRDQLG